MNNLTQEQVSDKSLDELLFDYGNTAYQEGVEGRSHDTIDGKAEKAFQVVKNRFQELEKQLIEVKRKYNQLFNNSSETEKAYKIKLAKHKKLHKAAIEIKADLLMRADRETNPDGTICKVVDVSATRWEMFNKALMLLQEKANNE